MVIANLISYILVLLGAVNWGLYGIFDFNLVSAIFMGPSFEVEREQNGA